jgi:Protein of unknown function (DUF2490)
MKQLVGVVLMVLAFHSSHYGQKQTVHVQQIWGAYFNQTRLSDHWGIWADVHLRTKEDFFTDLSAAIARVGLIYYVNDHLRLTAGYGYINHFPSDNHTGVSQPEHRPWQQIMWTTPSKRSRVIQSLRLEERFRRKISNHEELGEGYNFNYRLRYNFLLMLPLGKNAFAKNSLSLALNDEIQINMGKEIVNNYFDQNRFFAGFAYHVTNSSILQFGYMNQFVQTAAGNRYRSVHVPRIFYFHNLDMRKK